MIDKKIYWLASYPKSGNTWFRVFLSNLLQDKNEAVNINELSHTPIISSRMLFDEYSGLSSCDLSNDEIDLYRPQVIEQMNADASENIYLKVHDAYIKNSNKRFLIPKSATRGAIYFIRNPLDVAISFAHHSNTSIDKAITMMQNPKFAFAARNTELTKQLRQILLSWDMHVKSWTEKTNFPVLMMRYEDMKSNTFETFKNAVHFLGLDKNDQEIQKAIEFSSFENLKKQEEQDGFGEKAPSAESFFRKGLVNDWKKTLNKDQIDKIITNHQEVMKKYNYI